MKSAHHRVICLIQIVFLTILPAASLTGCAFGPLIAPPGTEPALPVIGTPENETSSALTETETPPELFYHTLTGLACEEVLSASRPISVCIENDVASVPYGLSVADVLVEAPVDNGTRFLALFTDLDAARYVGCIASTRPWLMAMSDAFGAIAVYNGTTDTAGAEPLHFPGSDTIDYVQNSALALFRKDPSRAFPHNLMTSGADIRAVLEMSLFSMTIDPEKVPFSPLHEGTWLPTSGTSATRVRVAVHSGTSCEFLYNPMDRTYTRFQGNAVMTDALTGNGIAFSNLLFLLCNVDSYHSASGTDYTLDVASGGQGYLVTGGSVTHIRFQTENGTLLFTDAAGDPLTVNCGKTYIALIKVSDTGNLLIQ